MNFEEFKENEMFKQKENLIKNFEEHIGDGSYIHRYVLGFNSLLIYALPSLCDKLPDEKTVYDIISLANLIQCILSSLYEEEE